MGMPTQPILDIMRRTISNLRFIENHSGPNGPYEVTQLINSFLGALAHPWEAMRDDLMALPLNEAEKLGWPHIAQGRASDVAPQSLGELIRYLRNSIAHGNIEFLPDGRGQIGALHLWNKDRGRRTWGASISIDTTRCFLMAFVSLIEDRHKNYGWYDQQSA
jgi:HEPN family protein